MQTLPTRVQAELQAAEALEAQETERRAAVHSVRNAADLVPQPEPEPRPSVTPEPVAPPATPPAPPEDFQAKYTTLKGMYQADVTRVKQTVTEQARVIGQLTQVVEELRQARKEEPAKQPQGPDPKDVEQFGADIIEMVTRYVEQKTTELESRLTALERQVTGVTQETAQTREQQFYALLDQLVPPWREINVDERWLAWLKVVDPVYRVPRQAALDRAFERMDAPAIADILRAFIASLPAPAPAAPSLENQVAPSATASAPPVEQAPKKPLVSTQAINDFYRDLGRGLYDTRQAEAKAIEAEINAAVAEGRVV